MDSLSLTNWGAVLADAATVVRGFSPLIGFVGGCALLGALVGWTVGMFVRADESHGYSAPGAVAHPLVKAARGGKELVRAARFRKYREDQRFSDAAVGWRVRPTVNAYDYGSWDAPSVEPVGSRGEG